MQDLEKTAVFHQFRAAALDEVEKLASEQGLTDLEKVAILGAVGKFLGGIATKGGRAFGRRGSKVMARQATAGGGKAVSPSWHIGAGNRLGEAGKWMAANPRAAGGMGLAAGAAPVGMGGAFAAGGAAGEAHQGARRAVAAR